MYMGDGSYKPSEYKPEVSLSQLLEKENELVARLNVCASAYESAKKNGLRTCEYTEDYNNVKIKLEKSRVELKQYLSDKLGVNV